jgi:conjugative relaxase-like TrwC/TraI family protein
VLSIGKITAGRHCGYERDPGLCSGFGDSIGRWVGAGARELGLSGLTSRSEYSALIVGSHPAQPGVRLRAGARNPKIAALDLTFSAPKSVSVLFAVASPGVSAALIASHEEAVRASLGYLEEIAVMVRRGHSGEHRQVGAGLVAVAYRHRMSRALDPQLHTHVVSANLTRGPDGRYTALHAAPLYRAAKTAGYLYQAHLRAGVRDVLGLEWGLVRKGTGELRELPSGVLRVFSQLHAHVEPVVAEKEAERGRRLSRAERARWAAIATRLRKQDAIDAETWHKEIAARASGHGLDREFVERIVNEGAGRRERGDLAGDGELELAGVGVGEGEFAALLARAGGLHKCAGTLDEATVLRAFAAAAAQGARIESVRSQAIRFAAHRMFLRRLAGR